MLGETAGARAMMVGAARTVALDAIGIRMRADAG